MHSVPNMLENTGNRDKYLLPRSPINCMVLGIIIKYIVIQFIEHVCPRANMCTVRNNMFTQKGYRLTGTYISFSKKKKKRYIHIVMHLSWDCRRYPNILIISLTILVYSWRGSYNPIR